MQKNLSSYFQNMKKSTLLYKLQTYKIFDAMSKLPITQPERISLYTNRGFATGYKVWYKNEHDYSSAQCNGEFERISLNIEHLIQQYVTDIDEDEISNFLEIVFAVQSI